MIYFIQQGDDGPVKIGYVKDGKKLRRRLTTMQVGNPDKLRIAGVMNGMGAEEQAIHATLADYHIRGEWFQFTNCVNDFIQENTEDIEHSTSGAQTTLSGRFHNIRFGDSQVADMKILCDRLGLKFGMRGVRSEVVHFALRVAARGYINELPEAAQE